MYETAFVFKTRRKYHLLLFAWIAILIQDAFSIPTTTTDIPFPCPNPCECFLNNNGLQSAKCSEISSTQQPLPNIHVLILEAESPELPCTIPANLSITLPQLNFFYLMNCSLTSIPADVFTGLSLLEEVDLSHNYIKRVDPSIFTSNRKLRYVNLQNNPFHLTTKPFITSKSIWEVDLSSCNITEIPFKMFKNLTSLKYLTLQDNRLETINENTLPNGLKRLNLAKNNIRKVPTAELLRLKHLKQIDLSKNPINCTCDLMGFQNWVSGKGEIFENEITCAFPRRYAGQNLLHVSQYDLCQAQIERELTTDVTCGPEQICSNQIAPMEDGYLADEGEKKNSADDDFVRDEVVPVKKEDPATLRAASPDDFGVSEEGSGDGDGTDIPLDVSSSSKAPVPAIVEESSVSTSSSTASAEEVHSSISAEGSVSESSAPVGESSAPVGESPAPVGESSASTNESSAPVGDSSASTSEPTSVENGKSESNAGSDVLNTSLADSSSSSSEPPITPPPSKELPIQEEVSQTADTTIAEKPDLHPPFGIDAETIKPLSDNKTRDTVVAGKLNNELSGTSNLNLGYVIPFAAIFLIILICLGVFLGQRSSQKKKKWKPNDTTANDGTELQDVSLLPNKSPKPSIVKNKYPSEKESEQTERLMKESEKPAPKSIWEQLGEPMENGSIKHIDEDDVDTAKLPNGHSAADKNSAQPIECTRVKVTTLPDSIPRTPIVIRNV